MSQMTFPDQEGDDNPLYRRMVVNRRLMGGIPIALTNENDLPRAEELETAEIRCTVSVRLFDLEILNDLAAYTKVLQEVSDGSSVIHYREYHYDNSRNTMRVFMEWSNRYAVPTPADQYGA